MPDKRNPFEEHATPGSVFSARSKSRFQDWKTKFTDLKERIQKKGRERLTIMIIPHTEKSILNFHINVYTISAVITSVALVMIISILSLVGKSGENLQNYGLGLDNEQFKLQSLKMAEEMVPLHNIISQYTNTIAELYVKLDGNASDGKGGVSQQTVIDSEITELKNLMEQCRSNKDECNQILTKEILRRVIFLSKQDNQNLKRAIDLSKKILAGLKTPEKQNILRHTPSIWPARGFLLSPYGWQMDQLLGRKIFRRGIEIGALPGTEVYATAPGYVSGIDYDPNYGLTVKLKHLYGMRTYYSHLDRTKVVKGKKVTKGQVIGYVGRSGNTPVYMLYYEVHVGTIAYNPHAFLNHLQDQWLIQPKP